MDILRRHIHSVIHVIVLLTLVGYISPYRVDRSVNEYWIKDVSQKSHNILTQYSNSGGLFKSRGALHQTDKTDQIDFSSKP